MTKVDWLNIIKFNPVAFGIEAGFDKLTDLHNDWIKLFVQSRNDLTIQAHRGSYKTTCVSIAIALMIVLFPDETMLFMRKTDDDIKEVIRSVKNLLRTEIFQSLSFALYGTNVRLTTDSMTIIDTNLKVGISGTPQLTGIGLGSSLTGKHYDIICTDDIVNLKDRISKAERDRTKIVYQELENIKNPGGRFINTGTPWHKEDAFLLMPNITKYDCYSTKILSDDEIKKLRSKMTASLFSANYELKHIADEEALFKDCKFYDGDIKNIEQGIGHIDSAYGGGDYTAFTIIKECDDKLLVYGRTWQRHIDDCVNQIIADHQNFKVGTIYTERNADKGYLAKELSNHIPMRTYHEDTNKFIKISTWLKRYWDDVYFVDGTDAEYIDMIMNYTENAEHDDAPDSLASIVREIKTRANPKILRKPIGL